MKLLYKDQFKKIRKNFFYFISLSLLVFIVSLTFTSVKTSIKRLEENYDTYLEEQQVEDFYFFMGKVDVNYLGASAIVNLCFELNLMTECGYALQEPIDPIKYNNLNFLINEKIEERPDLYEEIISGYITQFSDRFDYTIEKKKMSNIMIGDYYYKFMTITEIINIPYMVEGELPVNDYEIAIFPEFAKANNINIEDSYVIDETTYTVVGFFYSPEFLFPLFSMSTIEFDDTLQTLVLTNDNTIEALDENVFTKYLVRGDLSEIFDDFGYDTLLTSDLSLLGKNMQIVTIILPKEINFRITSLQTEVDNANVFIDMFLSLFILFIIVLLLVFMKRYIDKNKEDIKILHAIGYSNFEISKALLVLPIIVSLFVLLGYLAGLLVSNYLFEMYSVRYLFPKSGFELDFDIFLYSVIIPIVFLISINYIFIYITVSAKKKSKKRKHLRVFKFTPFRTVLTSLLLFSIISIMIVFGLSSNSMFTAFVDESKLGNNYSEMINLQYMVNDPLSNDYETYTKEVCSILSVNGVELNDNYKSSIYGIDPTNDLKLLINNDIDNNLLLEDGLIISDYLHSALSVNIGDEITFTIGNHEVTQTVVGISNELVENNLFMTKETLNSFYGLDNTYYNGIFITDDLYENEYIQTRIDYQNSLDEFASLLNISNIIMGFLVVLSIVLSIYMFSLVLISYLNDNKVNIAILKSIGYNNREINLKYLLNVYIVLIIAFALSIPVTIELLDILLMMLMNSIGFKLILELNILNTVIGFLILNIIFFSTIFLTNKYYDKISIFDVIKHNIN